MWYVCILSYGNIFFLTIKYNEIVYRVTNVVKYMKCIPYNICSFLKIQKKNCKKQIININVFSTISSETIISKTYDECPSMVMAISNYIL